MKKFKPLFRKTALAIALKPEGISLFLFDAAGNLKYEPACAIDEMKAFLGEYRPDRTLLVIPRSDVLQKELVFSKTGNFMEDLESRLAQLLPYPPEEMAYSLALDPSEASRGLLYAAPGQKINELLDNLCRSGVVVDEVVSEDQPVFWYFQEKAALGPVLVFDRTPERLLVLALKENATLSSTAYAADEPLKNVLSELSFSLLESGVKPVKAVISGSLETHEIAKALEIPVEFHEPESFEAKIIPCVFAGTKKWGSHAAISLLPSAKKLERKARTQNRLLTTSLAAFAVFVVCFSALVSSHLFFLKHKKSVLEKQIAVTAPEVSRVREMTGRLAAAREADYSKGRLLFLLRDLAARAPALLRLKELQVEGKNIVFRGESPSHALLTETVQVFEKMEGIKEVKLEHARLRKRLNQDFFDFEVTARWQN